MMTCEMSKIVLGRHGLPEELHPDSLLTMLVKDEGMENHERYDSRCSENGISQDQFRLSPMKSGHMQELTHAFRNHRNLHNQSCAEAKSALELPESTS